MKKRFTAIAALAVAAAMSLTACTQSQNAAPETQAAAETAAQGSEDKAEEPAPAPAPSADAVSLKMATGGTTGTYYAYGGVIANILNGKLGSLQLNVQSTGSDTSNE